MSPRRVGVEIFDRRGLATANARKMDVRWRHFEKTLDVNLDVAASSARRHQRPEVLGHGGLASLDMGVTFLTAATLWGAMPLATGEPASRRRWIATGVGLGLCFLAKSSAVILTGFLVLLGVGWLVSGWRRRRGSTRRSCQPAAPYRCRERHDD